MADVFMLNFSICTINVILKGILAALLRIGLTSINELNSKRYKLIRSLVFSVAGDGESECNNHARIISKSERANFFELIATAHFFFVNVSIGG